MTETILDEEQTLELLAIRKKRIEVRRKRVEAIKKNGLLFYKPHPKQGEFHEAGVRFKKRMVRTGNRWGKSTAGGAEDSAWMLGERIWIPETNPARRGGIPQRPTKGLVITTDWDKVDEIWVNDRGDTPGKLWTMLPSGFVKYKRKNHSGVYDQLIGTNGSILRFDTVKSFMTNQQGAESSDFDFIHVDEPCPEKMFKAHARGLIDTGGSFWFTLTPLAEFWINDLFFPADTGGLARDDVWAIEGTIYDNPYLTREAIDSYASLLTDDEKLCRLHGIPMHLTGLIYKEFSWDKHVLKAPPAGWKNWLTPPENWSIYVQIDPHPRTPHAVLFLAVGPHGNHVYYTDLFEHCTIPTLVGLIKEQLQGRRPVWCSADPLAFVEYPHKEIFECMADEFAACGLPVEKAPKNPSFGILEVKKQLTIPGMITFTPECRRTLWEIQRWCWDEDTNKPMDVDDHMMENLYRSEINNPVWIDNSNPGRGIEDEAFISQSFELEDVRFDEV